MDQNTNKLKMTLQDKLSAVQVDFKAKKSRFNSFGKYYFRSAEDILEAIKPFLKEHGLTVTINEQMASIDPPIMQVTAKISDGIDTKEAVAMVGVDTNQKGMQVPQQYGSASSYGKKYALGNLLLIDDTQDSDATNTHGRQAMDEDSMQKAISYIKSGGTVDAIKKKYNVSNAQEAVLAKL